MNTTVSPTHRQAFTLLELLVVITIIAILISLGAAVASKVVIQAKRVEARNAAIQIASAIKAYQTDYGKWPLDLDSDRELTRSELSDLYKILIASPRNDQIVQTWNPRATVFLNAPDATNGRNGLDDAYVYLDPWGEPFRVILDGEYDNQLSQFPEPFNDTFSENRPLREGVAVFSEGYPEDSRRPEVRAISSW